MATLQAGPGGGGFQISSFNITDYQDLTITSEAPTLIAGNFAPGQPNHVVQFAGSGFTFDANGTPIGGTVTSILEASSGQLLFDVSGFAVSVPQFTSWVFSTDAQAATQAALTTIFGGADQILGSEFNDSLAGFAGDDQLGGDAGNDFIDGGDGNDAAYALGAVNDYTVVTYNGVTALLPENAQLLALDGVDKIANVETLLFFNFDPNPSHWIPIPTPQQNFSALNYIASYGDLSNAFGANDLAGFDHYIYTGFYEGRQVTFSGLEYIASYGDLIGAFGANGDAGAAHYIQNGRGEGRSTSFDGLEYIASYGDLMAAFGANADAGAAHYIQNGLGEGRSTSFDGLEYIASYGDLIVAFGSNADAGATHFILSGLAEGRAADGFDAAQYLANYADLQAAFGHNLEAATIHYITTGYYEGRTDHA